MGLILQGDHKGKEYEILSTSQDRIVMKIPSGAGGYMRREFGPSWVAISENEYKELMSLHLLHQSVWDAWELYRDERLMCPYVWRFRKVKR